MKPYYYIANIVKVYDGDTVTAVVDLGFKTSVRIKHVYGYPEINSRAREPPDTTSTVKKPLVTYRLRAW